jgi:hypothetical protein
MLLLLLLLLLLLVVVLPGVVNQVSSEDRSTAF